MTPLQLLLADLVRGGLRRKRWKQRQLAHAVGITEKHLSQMLTGGTTSGSLAVWQRLLDAVDSPFVAHDLT